MIEANVLDISYKDLKLAVINGEVDLSNLIIFEEQKLYIESLGLHIHAGIIGTSHFIQIKNASGELFTEILACNADEVMSNNSLFLDPIQKIDSSVRQKGSFGNYQFSYDLIPFNNAEQTINTWTKDISEKTHVLYLEYAFTITGSKLPASKTILSLFHENNKILVRTVHEYQEEKTTVLSQSTLTL